MAPQINSKMAPVRIRKRLLSEKSTTARITGSRSFARFEANDGCQTLGQRSGNDDAKGELPRLAQL
jgi:hypothetical protein